jgi:CBS domain-containing protein
MVEPGASIRDVMSRGPISVDEKLTLRSLSAVLSELDVGVVLVHDSEGAAYVVSERDIVRALSEGADPDEVWAADIGTSEVVIADADVTVLDAAETMASAGVRHLPVVEGSEIVGVVSMRDVLPLLAHYSRGALEREPWK